MNKLEANISLLIITFFAAVQYVFLAAVPENISHFAFLSVTNFVGFLIMLAFFFNELERLDFSQIKQSIILSSELIIFNLFLLRGTQGIGATTTAAVLSTYFVFIAILNVIIFKLFPDRYQKAAIIFILIGLFFLMDARVKTLFDVHVLYLIIANIAFAAFIMSTGHYASTSNPSILALGQTLFCFLGALFLWAVEVIFFEGSFKLPSDKNFWSSVIFISFFIRGVYGIMQIYAQRYTSALNVSMIFSSEIIMTMFASPFLARLFDVEAEEITGMRVTGAVIMVFGLLMTEPDFFKFVSKLFSRSKEAANK